MSIGLFIFILYILIILFSWLQNKEKKSSLLMQKEEEYINKNSVTRDEARSPENSNNFKNVYDIGRKDEIIIDDEVRELYKEREVKTLTNKPMVMDKEEIISNQESGLRDYLPNNILINGIILSEIIAPPRALKPYKFKRYKRLGDYKV